MGLKNLYQLEMEKGKGITVTTSEYLLSLPYEKQMRILARHLKNLKGALIKKSPPMIQKMKLPAEDMMNWIKTISRLTSSLRKN